MQNQLASFIEILKVDRRIISFDEAATKHAVVRRPYFSSNIDELWEPRKINNIDIFAEMNLSANSIVKICFDTLAVFGYSTNDLKIEAIKFG